MHRQYYENQNYNHNEGWDPDFSRNVATFFISFGLILVTGFGVYYWQNAQAEEKQSELAAKIEELEESDESTGEVNSLISNESSKLSSSELITHSSNVGHLDLRMTEKYAVIVKVDGKFGKSERTIYHISEKIRTGIYRDVLDDFIEIEITKAEKSAADEITDYQVSLDKSGYKIDKKFEAEIMNYKGHLMTGKSSLAQIRAYIILSGGYAYKFAQISPLAGSNEDNENLLAIFKGMSIGEGGI